MSYEKPTWTDKFWDSDLWEYIIPDLTDGQWITLIIIIFVIMPPALILLVIGLAIGKWVL